MRRMKKQKKKSKKKEKINAKAIQTDEGMKFLINKILDVAKTNTPLKPDGGVSVTKGDQANSSEKGCCNL